MAYFKINGVDLSPYVNKLSIQTNKIYNSRTNAKGDTVVKYINSKRIINVGIVALNEDVASTIANAIEDFQVTISFRDPLTKNLSDANCIIPKNNIEYYTIRADKVQTKAFVLMFEEL